MAMSEFLLHEITEKAQTWDQGNQRGLQEEVTLMQVSKVE
jgi:hypothetical protein